MLPSVEQVECLFGALLIGESPRDDERVVRSGPPVNSLFYPFSEQEILDAKSNWGNSAPGADGLRVDQVRKCGDKTLGILYTIIFMRGVRVRRFVRSRITLIYKNGDRTNASNGLYNFIDISKYWELLKMVKHF